MKLWKSNKDEFEAYMNYYKEQKGFYNEDLDPTKKPVAKITDIWENFKQFIVSDFNVTYIKKILYLLEQQNIKVITQVDWLFWGWERENIKGDRQSRR